MSLTSKKVYGALTEVTNNISKKLDDAIVGIYTPGGSLEFDDLPALSSEVLGMVYEITDDFTTTADFVEGAGVNFPVGTKVAIVNAGTNESPVYKYDVTTGAIEIDNALSSTSKNPVENKVVKVALDTKQDSSTALQLGETSTTAYRGDRGKTAYDDSQTNKTAIGTLANLTTTEKTNLVGAINEVAGNAVKTTAANQSIAGYKDFQNTLRVDSSNRIIDLVSLSESIAKNEPNATSISRAYAIGDLLVYQGKLYKVKVAIAQGGDISSGITNYLEAATIADLIGALQANVSGKADKVSDATNGNFAALDANGNLIDSDKANSDFVHTTGNETIGGEKTFLSDIEVSDDFGEVTYGSTSLLVSNDYDINVTGDIALDGDDLSADLDNTTIYTNKKIFLHSADSGSSQSKPYGIELLTDGAPILIAIQDSSSAINIENNGDGHSGGDINVSTNGGEINLSAHSIIHINSDSDLELESAGLYLTAIDSDSNYTVGGTLYINTPEKVLIEKHYDSTTSSYTGGNLEVEGIITVNGSDYAERFETLEDCPVCRFVTLDGEKIRLAQPEDGYILGVTSEAPAIVGDKDNEGIPVGLVGKLWAESDGTCKVNGYAVSGADGIATDGGSTGYRVMAVDGNRVKVLVR